MDGNTLELLCDGEAFVPAMLESVRAATKTVDLEMFRVHPGSLSALLTEELVGCAMRGVRVRLLVDAIGSRATKAASWRAFVAGGCHLRLFAPITLRTPATLIRRDHRKILLVDSVVAFTGGMSFDDVFYRNPVGPSWRETMVRLEGPIIADVERSFALSWGEAGGEVGDYARSLVSANIGPGIARARFVPSTASVRHAHALFLAAITAARHSIYITNPFVMPDVDILHAMKRAAAGGVDVRLLLPGGPAFDRFKVIRLAMNGLYHSLLSAGIRIFEYQPAMLHAKTIVIDSAWCSVGSSNLDARSLYYNHEADLTTCDAVFVDKVERSFLADVASAEQVTLARWRSRSLSQRLKEFAAGALRMQL